MLTFSKLLFSSILCAGCVAARGQLVSESLPPAPTPQVQSYVPPTQHERFTAYVKSSFGLQALAGSAVRAGIQQARGTPTGWSQDAAGYGQRFGSSYGIAVVRGTPEYGLSEVFHEDIRHKRCLSPCPESRFKLAFENTFMARKGDDGHEALSVARLVGPLSGSAVAVNIWYPAGSKERNLGTEAGIQFGLLYFKNLILK